MAAELFGTGVRVCGNTIRPGAPMGVPWHHNQKATARVAPPPPPSPPPKLIIRRNRLRALRARTAAGKAK